MEAALAPEKGERQMAPRDVFVAFVREHSKFIYFLLAAAAAATTYGLGQIGDVLTLDVWFVILWVPAIVCWAVSFWTGCQRLISMLAGLHDIGIAGNATSHAATQAASSSAKPQLIWFLVGAGFYAVWVLMERLP